MTINTKFSLLMFLAFIYHIKTQSISDSLNGFTVDFLTAVSRHSGSPQNLALSPYTVWTLLSIIDEGARGNTAQQLESILRIPDAANKNNFRSAFKSLSNILSLKDQDVNLEIYNSIFTTAEQKINPNFRNISQVNYDINIQPIDFRNPKIATDIINKHVAQATRNRITNFIHPEDLTLAEIFIVSALYFKGSWMSPFNRSQTRRETFYDEEQNKVGEVDMMHQINFFPYAKLEWIKGYCVELPYGKGDKMSMIVILPYKENTLANMLQLMTQHPFSKITGKLNDVKEQFEGEDVKVYLPRFIAKSDLTLNAILEQMGISDVFDENRADLLGIFSHYLYISRLIQRAEIDVNEEGTIASAASGASIANKIPPPKFMANKPFLYFVVSKPTKCIVFAGRITIPP